MDKRDGGGWVNDRDGGVMDKRDGGGRANDRDGGVMDERDGEVMSEKDERRKVNDEMEG